MTTYALDEHKVSLPEAGRFWVAPGAHVMGRVTLGLDVGNMSVDEFGKLLVSEYEKYGKVARGIGLVPK